MVGSQVVPGTYRTAGSSTCYWARLASLDTDNILANNDMDGQQIVTISPSDAAFQSTGCGTWTPEPSSGPRANSMGDGIWAVGIDISPGTYETTSTGACYWARESSFSGGGDDTIDNDNAPSGPVAVTIEPTDVAFLSLEAPMNHLSR